MPINPKLKNKEKKQPNKLNQAVRYSSLAFEMAIVILAGVFGGIKLDQVINTHPLFTIVFSLLSVFAALYFAVKDFLK